MSSKGRPAPTQQNPRETILLRDLAPRADVRGRGTKRIFGEAEDSDNDPRRPDEDTRTSSGRAGGKKPRR